MLDIVNPIQICSNIERLTVGYDHCVANTKDGRLLAWGNASAFSKRVKAFATTPIDITEEYGGTENIKLIRAGRYYTVILTMDNKIRIMGQ